MDPAVPWYMLDIMKSLLNTLLHIIYMTSESTADILRRIPVIYAIK